MDRNPNHRRNKGVFDEFAEDCFLLAFEMTWGTTVFIGLLYLGCVAVVVLQG